MSITTGVILHWHPHGVLHYFHTLFKTPPPCMFTQQQLPSASAAASSLNFTTGSCLCRCQRRRGASHSPRQGGSTQMMAAGVPLWPLTDLRMYVAHTPAQTFFLLSALCWYLGCTGLWKKDHLQVDKEDLAPSITLWINCRCLRAPIKAHCSMLSLLSGIVPTWMAWLSVSGACL